MPGWLPTSLTEVLGAVAFPFTLVSLSRAEKRAPARSPVTVLSGTVGAFWLAPVTVRSWNWCFFALAPVLYSPGVFESTAGAAGLGTSTGSAFELVLLRARTGLVFVRCLC